MPKRFTPVSEAALQQISDAINSMLHDPSLPRTKRQIEKLSGLSHATVARAFVQDNTGQGPQSLRLNERLDALCSPTTGKASAGASGAGLEERLKERNQEIKQLKVSQAAHLQALYAYYLALNPEDEAAENVIPMGANRRRGL